MKKEPIYIISIRDIGTGMILYAIFIAWAWWSFSKDYISSESLLLGATWLCYTVSSIGIIMRKKWGRIFGICVAGIAAVWSTGSSVYAIYEEFLYNVGERWAFLGLFYLLIFVILPSLFLLIILNLPKIKEQFR